MNELITQIYTDISNHSWSKIVERVIRKHEIHFCFYQNRLFVKWYQISIVNYVWQIYCYGEDEKIKIVVTDQ